MFQWFSLVIFCFVTLINAQIDWECKNPLFSNSYLYSVKFYGEKFLIIGSYGASFVSEDGDTWVHGFPRTIYDLTYSAYGEGKFVCSGSYGSLFCSVDGIAWEDCSIAGHDFYDIEYGNGKYIVIADVNSSSGIGELFISDDGVNWSYVKNEFNYGLKSMIFVDSQFIISADSNHIYTSNDGMKWNSYNIVTETGNLNELFYVNKKYISSDAGLILMSDDAINWKSVAIDCIYPSSITFGNELYVLVSEDGKILTSVDAMNWTERYNDSSKIFKSIDYGKNKFIAVGCDDQYTDTALVIASTDGNSWTEINSRFTNKSLGGAVYGNNCYIIVGDSGTIYSSHDGNTWKPSVSNVKNYLITVIYEKEQFVAFGSKTIITSPDGIEWKKSNYQPDTTKLGGLRSMAYGDGKYVAVGYSTLISSSDGINWVGSSDLEMDYSAVAYGNGYFITFNDNDEVLRSSDGIKWTLIGNMHENVSIMDCKFINIIILQLVMNGILRKMN